MIWMLFFSFCSIGAHAACDAQKENALFIAVRTYRANLAKSCLSFQDKQRLEAEWTEVSREQNELWQMAGESDAACNNGQAYADKPRYDARVRVWLPKLDALAKELSQWFSPQSRKVETYVLVGKNWIDSSLIPGDSPLEWKCKLASNTEPTTPDLVSENDFKLYQSLTIEIATSNGRIEYAKIKNRDARAGTTVHIKTGEIRTTDSKLVWDKNRCSAEVHEKVEGNPSVWGILLPDQALDSYTGGEIPTLGYRPISLTVGLRMSALHQPVAFADASAFPSAKFWINGTLFRTMRQSKVAEYFSSPENNQRSNP